MDLIDTSVWALQRNPAIRSWFASGLQNGELALCDMVVQEILHSASTPGIYAAMAGDLESVPRLSMDRWEWRRTLEVYGLLAAQGHQLHRSVKHPDLLIAACAERHDVTLVHYDRDYDAIGLVTGQSMRWVAPRGTL